MIYLIGYILYQRTGIIYNLPIADKTEKLREEFPIQKRELSVGTAEKGTCTHALRREIIQIATIYAEYGTNFGLCHIDANVYLGEVISYSLNEDPVVRNI